MKNIFAISGSLRKGSSNHSILEFIGKQLPPEISYNLYDGLSTIPAFDPGLDNEHPPEPVTELRDQLAEADVIIICTPEICLWCAGCFEKCTRLDGIQWFLFRQTYRIDNCIHRRRERP